MAVEVMFTQFVIILFFGILILSLSRWLRLPGVLFLVLLGIALQYLTYNQVLPIDFPQPVIHFISLLALILIVFTGSSHLKLREVDKHSGSILFFIVLFTALVVLAVTPILHYLFDIPLLTSVIVALIMTGPSTAVILPLFKKVESKAVDTLKYEALLNPQLEVVIPFFLVELYNAAEGVQGAVYTTMDFIRPFLLETIVGVGTGVVIGLIVSKILKKDILPIHPSTFLFVTLFLTYILAENLNGSGVLALLTIAITVKNIIGLKKTLFRPLESWTDVMSILFLVILGTALDVPSDLATLKAAGLIFLVFLIVRLIAVRLVFRNTFTDKDTSAIVFTVPKGIAPFFMLFYLQSTTLPGIDAVTPILAIFLFGATIFGTMSGWILKRHQT